MITFNIFRRLLLSMSFICLVTGVFAQSPYHIEFNGNGQLTAPPPLVVHAGDSYFVAVNFDHSYFEKKIKDAIDLYMTAMENISQDTQYGYLDADPTALKIRICALGTQVKALSQLYLSTAEQNIITQRLTALDWDNTCNPPATVPDLSDLVAPAFSIDVYYYDKTGKLLSSNIKQLDQPTGAIPNSYALSTVALAIPDNTGSIRFELREVNLMNQLILKEASGANSITQQQALARQLKQIKLNLTPAVLAQYTELQKLADAGKKFLTGDLTLGVDAAWVVGANAKKLVVATIAKNNLDLLKNNDIKNWLLRWMWLTKGQPKSNPFEFQAQPLIAGTATAPAAKVTEKEKALVDMYENMVSKNAFRLNSVATLDKDLGTIADIKARMKIEAAAGQTATSSDIFWYKALINCSPAYDFHIPMSTIEHDYMISHDAANQYTLMTEPLKEITEKDRLFVFLQNKKPGDPVKIDVTATAITTDIGQVTQETNLSFLQDKAASGTQLEKDVADFLQKYEVVDKQMTFLLSLSAAPKLPLQFAKSTTPIYQTENQIFNNNFTAPTVAEYKLSTGPSDKLVEVYRSQVRVDKLYNLRFKAGILYSGLDKTIYSKNTDNSFSASTDKAGADGVFGIQIFPFKTDIRSINLFKGRVSPFIFAGFSMKGITQNFYPSAGLEIFSGVAIAYTRHYGKSDVLTGTNGVPSQISSTWVRGDAVSLLVDAAFFTSLFKFGSNKSLLGF